MSRILSLMYFFIFEPDTLQTVNADNVTSCRVLVYLLLYVPSYQRFTIKKKTSACLYIIAQFHKHCQRE